MFNRTIDIGKLRKRITFLVFSDDATDEIGQSTAGLVELKTVWGDIYPVRGKEIYEIQKVQSSITHKCYVRYRKEFEELDSTNFLKYKGDIFSIESVIDINSEHKLMEIYCSKHINKEDIPYELSDED